MRTRRIATADAVLCLVLFVAAGFLAGTGDLPRALLAAALACAWGWTAALRASARRRVPAPATPGRRRA